MSINSIRPGYQKPLYGKPNENPMSGSTDNPARPESQKPLKQKKPLLHSVMEPREYVKNIKFLQKHKRKNPWYRHRNRKKTN